MLAWSHTRAQFLSLTHKPLMSFNLVVICFICSQIFLYHFVHHIYDLKHLLTTLYLLEFNRS